MKDTTSYERFNKDLTKEIVASAIAEFPYEVKSSEEVEKVGALSDDFIEIFSQKRNPVRNSKLRLKDGVKVKIIINPFQQRFEKEATLELSSVIGRASTDVKTAITSALEMDAIKIIEVPCVLAKISCKENEANFCWNEFQILIDYDGKKHFLRPMVRGGGDHYRGIWNAEIQSFDLYNYLVKNELCEIYRQNDERMK